jgi:hypothetical protein
MTDDTPAMLVDFLQQHRPDLVNPGITGMGPDGVP